MRLNWAPAAFGGLKGIFCIHKPYGIPVVTVVERIQSILMRDLNELPCRQPREIVKVEVAEENLPTLVTIPDLADHPLVVGHRYKCEDFNLKWIHRLSRHSSGVLLMEINSDRRTSKLIKKARLMRVYRVSGQFGKATDNFSEKGRIIERTTWKHIREGDLERICAAVQAGHQKHMFTQMGINLQSQEAYEIATRGLIKPQDGGTPPVLYSVRCVEFNPPNFILEIHTINETCNYLSSMVHHIGLHLKSSAICTKILRTKYGFWRQENSLIQQQWSLENILGNIRLCRHLVSGNSLEPTVLVNSSQEEEKKLLSAS